MREALLLLCMACSSSAEQKLLVVHVEPDAGTTADAQGAPDTVQADGWADAFAKATEPTPDWLCDAKCQDFRDTCSRAGEPPAGDHCDALSWRLDKLFGEQYITGAAPDRGCFMSDPSQPQLGVCTFRCWYTLDPQGGDELRHGLCERLGGNCDSGVCR